MIKRFFCAALLTGLCAADQRTIYVAAQTGEGRDLAAQTRGALRNVEAALADAGARMADLVRLDVHFLTGQDPEPIRRVLAAARVPDPLMLPVGALPSGGLLQIAAVAMGKALGAGSGVVLRPNGAVSIAEGSTLYLSGQSDSAIGKHEPVADMGELTRRSLQGLALALQGGSAEPGGVAGLTVYLSSLQQLDKARAAVRRFFPDGKVPPTSYVARSASDGASPWVEIDAEAIGGTAPARHEFLNPPGLVASRFYTYVVRAAAGRAIYISAQSAPDPAEIYERIDRALREAGASFEDVVKVRAFPVPTKGVMAAINEVRMKHYLAGRPPASTLLGWDGAQLQIDAIAVVPAK